MKMEKEIEVVGENLGPEILYEEFEIAISELKNGKASGVDNIPRGLLKVLGNSGKSELYDIWKKM